MAEILLKEAYKAYIKSNSKNSITMYYHDYVKGDISSLWAIYHHYLLNEPENANREIVINHLDKLMIEKVPIFKAITKENIKEIAKFYHKKICDAKSYDPHIYKCYIYAICQIKGFAMWEEYIEELLTNFCKIDDNFEVKFMYEAHVAGNLDGTYGLATYFDKFDNICYQGIAVYLEDVLYKKLYQPILVKRFLNLTDHETIMLLGEIIVNQRCYPGTGILFYQMVVEKYNKHLLESYEILSDSDY